MPGYELPGECPDTIDRPAIISKANSGAGLYFFLVSEHVGMSFFSCFFFVWGCSWISSVGLGSLLGTFAASWPRRALPLPQSLRARPSADSQGAAVTPRQDCERGRLLPRGRGNRIPEACSIHHGGWQSTNPLIGFKIALPTYRVKKTR